jgi:hypothetical protein
MYMYRLQIKWGLKELFQQKLPDLSFADPISTVGSAAMLNL